MPGRTPGVGHSSSWWPCPAQLTGSNSRSRAREPLKALLPPTYLRYQATFEEVQDLAKNGLPAPGWNTSTAPARRWRRGWDWSATAATTSPTREGMGSYLLCTFIDASLLERPCPKVLRCCRNAMAAGNAERLAPTGAVREDRILLGAQRCLTHVNEDAGDWPAWAPEGRHNSLAGLPGLPEGLPRQPHPVRGGNGRAARGDGGPDGSGKAPAAERGGRRQEETGLAYQPGLHPILGRNLAALLQARAGRLASRGVQAFKACTERFISRAKSEVLPQEDALAGVLGLVRRGCAASMAANASGLSLR